MLGGRQAPHPYPALNDVTFSSIPKLVGAEGDEELDCNSNTAENWVTRVKSVPGTRPAWITSWKMPPSVVVLAVAEPHP